MSTIKVIEVPSRDSFVSTEVALQALGEVVVKTREAMIEDRAVLVKSASDRTLLIVDKSQWVDISATVKELQEAAYSVQAVCLTYPDKLDLALIELKSVY